MSELGSTAAGIASVVLLLSLPILIYRAAHNILHVLVPEEIFQVPIIFLLSRLIGFAWAALWMMGDLGERAFRLSEIFTQDSIWAIPVHAFLTQQGNLFSYDVGGILDWILGEETGLALTVAIAVIVAELAVAALCVTLFGHGRYRMSAILAATATTMITAWQTVYLTTLALWLVHRINFWSLLLIAIYIQYRKNHHE